MKGGNWGSGGWGTDNPVEKVGTLDEDGGGDVIGVP